MAHPIADGFSVHLDAIRAIAALLVVIGHARGLWLVDYPQVGSPNLVFAAGYLMSGLGHQAVIIFFVLSGLLIVRTGLQAHLGGSWSLGAYGLARLTRLWIVLLPALAIGGALDLIGVSTLGPESIYGGHRPTAGIVPVPVILRLTPSVGLGNAVFLQDLFVAPLGSNSALWSISYEFWFYVAFGLAVTSFARAGAVRLLAMAGLLILPLILGPLGVGYFLIWLLGGSLNLLPSPRAPHRRLGRVWLVSTGLMLAATTVVSRTLLVGAYVGELGLAVAFVAFLWAVRDAVPSRIASGYRRAARQGAGFSYTLYAVHLPFLVFLTASFVPSERLQPTGLAIVSVAVAVGVAILYAFLLARVTEARTGAMRRFLVRRLGMQLGRPDVRSEAASGELR